MKLTARADLARSHGGMWVQRRAVAAHESIEQQCSVSIGLSGTINGLTSFFYLIIMVGVMAASSNQGLL
jgi:hypothetical protein